MLQGKGMGRMDTGKSNAAKLQVEKELGDMV
jgi:hypothetical protein